MAIFVNDREGDNWWGTSTLRAAYQHWYRKSKYRSIDVTFRTEYYRHA